MVLALPGESELLFYMNGKIVTKESYLQIVHWSLVMMPRQMSRNTL